MAIETVTIDRLGGLGDGIAEGASGRLHIPFTTPGDLARVEIGGKSAALVELLSPGPARIAPRCRHFGRCGGCAFQHLDPTAAAAWKRERVQEALRRAGLSDAPVADTVAIPPGSRRRATLAGKRIDAGVVLGFAERASHRLIDLAECPVLRPELVALVAPLRALLARILERGESSDLGMSLTDSGIEITIIRRRELSLVEREALASFAEAHDLARIAWKPAAHRDAEPISARRAPMVMLGGYSVALPPGAFLQPSAEGEAALTRLVLRALDAGDTIVDLFSGLGTFALPASARSRIAAYDGDAEAIGALSGAIRANGLSKRIAATRRDLFRDPLTASELNRFTAAIVDPPRAGAEAQCRQIAQSTIARVAAVSCNPGTFARDAAIMVAGGYRLDDVTPVDQFPWTTHVELVAAFGRSD
ncbi:MAG TPA: class I SAM-dependent RNA methyltransferase [Alphaproteobacteria bacterium]|nr:class I SAM-dependent RNA methyltransferase [Alphaproteobacteria bacterium]